MTRFGKLPLASAFNAASLLAVLLAAAVGAVVLLAFQEIKRTAADTRDTVMPVILERQRTAINLQRLGQFGDVVLYAGDPEKRRENLLNARILSQDAAFETNPEVLETVRDTFAAIRFVADTRQELAKDDQTAMDDLAAMEAESDLIKAELDRNDAPARDKAAAIVLLLGKIQVAIARAMAERELEALTGLRDACRTLSATLRELSAATGSDALRRDISDIAQRSQQILALRESVLIRLLLIDQSWRMARGKLSSTANGLSMGAASLAAERFDAIAEASERGMLAVVFALACGTAGMGLMALLFMRHVSRPLIQAAAALERAEDDPELSLPSPPIKELDAVNRAAERQARLMARYRKRSGELEEAKMLADQASQAKSDFLAVMSHEIRTPLNTIAGMTEVAAELRIEGEQRRFCQVIKDASRQLQHIVDDILDFSKIEAGKLELDRTDFDLPALLSAAVEAESLKAGQKQLTLELAIASGVPQRLRGDPARLRQILDNLVDNAVKFTERGGVSVRALPLGAEQSPPGRIGLRFEVADRGVGVPEDKRELIFDAFRQADGSTTRKYGGTGLGLAICKRIANLMDGDVGLTPNPGGGSVFFFTAFFEAPGPQLAESPKFDKNAILAMPLRILLVEDNVANRKIVELFLGKGNMTIDEAENGRAALDVFCAGSFDLVLMDMEMPVMDGYEATKAIRDWERKNGRPPTPIVALTAHAWTEHMNRALDSGCDGFLSKPVSKDSLLRAIFEAVRSCAEETVRDASPPSPPPVAPLPTVPEARSTDPASEQAPAPAADALPQPAPEDCHVTPDEDIADMIPGFLAAIRSDMASMREHLANDRFLMLSRIGHNLKGSGRSYGFAYLTEIGAYLEKVSRREDAPRVDAALAALAAYLDVVRID